MFLPLYYVLSLFFHAGLARLIVSWEMFSERTFVQCIHGTYSLEWRVAQRESDACSESRVPISTKFTVPGSKLKLTSCGCISFRVPSSTCHSTWEFTSSRFRVLSSWIVSEWLCVTYALRCNASPYHYSSIIVWFLY